MMRLVYFIVLFAALAALASAGSIVRIEANKIYTTASLTQVTVQFFYNNASSGLAGGAGDLGKFTFLSVNDTSVPTNNIQYSGSPGIFFVQLTPALSGFAGQTDFPDGSYVVDVRVHDGGLDYEDIAPNAFIVIKKKSVPETDAIVVALFVILALLAMRMHFHRKKK